MATKAGATAKPRSRIDGRHAWRERNRNAVVDALLDLYLEGAVNPGARVIAERSRVSRRSLFRYFDDMDDMCRVAITRHQERVSHLFELDGLGVGTVEDRIDRIVAQRIRLFDAVAPVRRIARLRAPYQPILANELKRTRELLSRQVEEHFAAELDTLDPDARRSTLSAADVLTSFDGFDVMRSSLGLLPNEIAETLRTGLSALFRSC
jgi:AcrR family transcriptional regulator